MKWLCYLWLGAMDGRMAGGSHIIHISAFQLVLGPSYGKVHQTLPAPKKVFERMPRQMEQPDRHKWTAPLLHCFITAWNSTRWSVKESAQEVKV